MKVTAKVTRAGDWWAVEVPEVPGVFTQVRRLDQVAAQVTDAITLMTGEADVDVDLDVRLPAHDLTQRIADLHQAASEAARAQEHVSREMRALVSELRDRDDLTVRDVGVLLGVSPQRVSQLANS